MASCQIRVAYGPGRPALPVEFPHELDSIEVCIIRRVGAGRVLQILKVNFFRWIVLRYNTSIQVRLGQVEIFISNNMSVGSWVSGFFPHVSFP